MLDKCPTNKIMNSVKTQFITLFGKQYKVRCPAGQETVLKQTEDLLNEQLLVTKQNSGLTSREDIIMMTALNLCRDLVDQKIQAKDQQRQLEESQASAMLNANPQVKTAATQSNDGRLTNTLSKARIPGSAIAQAASKASKILKDNNS